MNDKSAGNRRRDRAFDFLRPFAHLLLAPYRLKIDNPARDLEPPFLVLCNHVTDYDMIIAGMAFRHSLRFVCSEDYLCGKLAKPLKKHFDVIPMFKAGAGLKPSREILRALKNGESVCMFPEGRHSPDGRTGPFKDSVASLARAAKCPVVCLRIDGYFVNPRWAFKARKGPITAECVRVYSPDETASMEPQALLESIRSDLSLDANQLHRGKNEYRGKALAEHLEESYFLCPECGAWYALKSEGDSFRCTACGAEGKISADGVLTGDFRFTGLPEWRGFEWEALAKKAAAGTDEVLIDSGEVKWQELSPETEGNVPLGTVRLCATAKEIRFGDQVRNFDRIPALSLRNGPTLLLEDGTRHYEFLLEGKPGDPYRILSLLAHEGEWYRYEG